MLLLFWLFKKEKALLILNLIGIFFEYPCTHNVKIGELYLGPGHQDLPCHEPRLSPGLPLPRQRVLQQADAVRQCQVLALRGLEILRINRQMLQTL